MAATDAVQSVYALSDWYSKHAQVNRLTFISLKTVQLLCASAIPIVSLGGNSSMSHLTTAVLGGAVALIEGFSQLNQFQANWLRYRYTSESLKREQFLFQAAGGPYATAPNPNTLFIDRSDAVISGELSKWSKSHEQPTSSAGAQA